MLSDKEVKKEFKKKAWKNPEKYYAVSVLKEEGYKRKICKCGKPFWTVNEEQKECGDPACSGGYRFIGATPAKKEMGYVETWKAFSRLFSKLGYKPIPRYPVVARWRDDEYWVGASIYDFQPYVVSGEVEPPANPLVVPQFCLRFNDIDNVGLTGSHYTGFVMIGQHAFMPPEKWNQAQYFRDIHTWLKKGLGLPNEEITFHEDAWAGGGNFGPCMEYFSRGLELGNQVYMMFEKTASGQKELKIKVLDMGMGHERNTWFSKGSATSYDAVFPTVMKKIYKKSRIEVEEEIMRKFLPYSSYLNADEVESVEKVWKKIEKEIKIKNLKERITPLSAVYSVGEHSRSLLVAISDGALPSNVGGGYNLRVILRRALTLIDRYKLNVELFELCKEHARYLKGLFPELSKNLNEVGRIIEVEQNKYENTKHKTKAIVEKIVKKGFTEEKLIELYDSQGITPELVKEEAEKLKKKVKIPEDFYVKITERHEKQEQKHRTEREEKIDVDAETKIMYYGNYKKTRFRARVVKIIKDNVVLDKTYFYPVSGGQMHDKGVIGKSKVVDVFKQGKTIIHKVDKTGFREGDMVDCLIDFERRKQLTQNHTAAHIINASARKILGNHVNQAGAFKDVDKARLDITHFESISEEELRKIEEEANKIIRKKIAVRSKLMPRGEAEKMYGMNIYQGGAVPGKEIRIIDIEGTDIEACGGTHVNSTAEIGEIKLLKSTKIQDGIVRIIFVAGKAAKKEEKKEEKIIEEAAKLLKVGVKEAPLRAEELFSKWKKARKTVKKKKKIDIRELELKVRNALQLSEDELLRKTAEILKTQPEHVVKTISRFKKELKEFREKLKS